MSAAPFVRQVYEGRDAQRLQSTIEPVAQQIDNIPLLRGVLLKKQYVWGATDIQHGLGRPVVGWIVVRQRGAPTVFDEQDDNPSPGKTLRLNAKDSGVTRPVTIDVWVF